MYVYVCVCACVYVCMYVHTYVCKYVCTYARTYISIHNNLANKDVGNVSGKRAKGTRFAKECDREATETNSTKESSM